MYEQFYIQTITIQNLELAALHGGNNNVSAVLQNIIILPQAKMKKNTMFTHYVGTGLQLRYIGRRIEPLKQWWLVKIRFLQFLQRDAVQTRR